jgi:hypothetical protein
MRGKDEQQLDVFSYISPEQRVPQDHPLRSLRVMTDEALQQLQPRFNRLYAKTGRPSIAPEKLISAGTTEARVGLVRTGPMMRPRWPHGSTRKLYFRHGVIAGTGANLAAEKGMTPAQNHRKLTAGMDFGSLVRTFER